jgi:hypothetical protein
VEFLLFSNGRYALEGERIRPGPTEGDYWYRGSERDETPDGGAGKDTLDGSAGDDLLIGGAGNDRLEGGEGIDLASFARPAADYTVEVIAPATSNGPNAHAPGPRVTNRTGPATEGLDTLEAIEGLRFSDKSVAFDFTSPASSSATATAGGGVSSSNSGGNAGITAKVLGAVFGKSAVSNTEYAWIGLDLLDTKGYIFEGLIG